MLKESENHLSWATDFPKEFALRSGVEGAFLWVKSQWHPVLFRTFLLKTIEAVSF
jgi:hypothetical protein